MLAIDYCFKIACGIGCTWLTRFLPTWCFFPVNKLKIDCCKSLIYAQILKMRESLTIKLHLCTFMIMPCDTIGFPSFFCDQTQTGNYECALYINKASSTIWCAVPSIAWIHMAFVVNLFKWLLGIAMNVNILFFIVKLSLNAFTLTNAYMEATLRYTNLYILVIFVLTSYICDLTCILYFHETRILA